MLPKKACDVNRCEVARILKLTGSGDVEPLPFIVPRKFEGYQPDIYPPSYAGIPALSTEEWREGQNSNPILMVPLVPRFDVVSGAGRYVHHQKGRRHSRLTARSVCSARRDGAGSRAGSDPLAVAGADGDVAARDVACADDR